MAMKPRQVSVTVGEPGARVRLADRATPNYPADPEFPKRRVAMCPDCGSAWTMNTRVVGTAWLAKGTEHLCWRCGAVGEA